MISIIVPHYNSFDLLKKLLDTVDFSSGIQVVVVDDKSDHYEQEIESLLVCFPCVEFYRNSTEKKGAGVCRNIGISKAKGDWLLFADADDRFTNEAFDKIALEIESVKSTVDCIFFKPLSFDIENNRESNRHSIYSELVEKYLSSADESIRYKFVVPWSKVVRKDLVERKKLLFDEVRASNDIMFSLRLGLFSDAVHASRESIYIVSEHGSGLTMGRCKKTLKSRFVVMMRYNKLIDAVGMKEYQCGLFSVFYLYWKIIDLRLAVKVLLRFVRRSWRIF